MDGLKSVFTPGARWNQSNNRDEHHTLHTKLLADSSNDDKMELSMDESICSMDDFTGGPICDDQFDVQSKQHICDNNTNFNRSITTSPADSSGGFHNTLSVLEHHLNKKKYHNLSQQLLSVDHNITNIKNDSHLMDEKISRPFELELEAIERLYSVWNKTKPTDNSESPSKQTEDNVPNSNEYIYHVARSRSGQLYLRVRRSLHLDQGMMNDD